MVPRRLATIIPMKVPTAMTPTNTHMAPTNTATTILTIIHTAAPG